MGRLGDSIPWRMLLLSLHSASVSLAPSQQVHLISGMQRLAGVSKKGEGQGRRGGQGAGQGKVGFWMG